MLRDILTRKRNQMAPLFCNMAPRHWLTSSSSETSDIDYISHKGEVPKHTAKKTKSKSAQ
jgi:hypothetical protein